MQNQMVGQGRYGRLMIILGIALTLASVPGCKRGDGEAPAVETKRQPHLPLWPARARSSFTFSLTSGTSLGAMPAMGEVGIVGKLDVFVDAVEGDTTRLHLVPSKLKLEKPRSAPSDAIDRLLADLGRPFGVEFQKGVLAAYEEPEESSLLAFGFRRQLAVMLQRANATESGASKWSGQEWDASGLANVDYELDAEEPGAFRWKKTRYVEVLATKGAHAALKDQSWKPEIAESDGQIRVDASGVVEIRRKEVLRVEMTKGQYLRSKYTAHLERLSGAEPSAPANWPELVRREVADALPPMKTDALDAIRFADRSWDDVLASLTKGAQSKTKDSPTKDAFAARQAAFHAAVGLLRIDKKNVESARAVVLEGGPLAGTLQRALASASTLPALSTLIELSLDSNRSLAERRQSAASLLRAEIPPPEILPSLLKFASEDDLREYGILGLGTFGRRWRLAEESSAAEQATQRLAAELAGATTTEQKKTCLLAIANLGDSALFDQVVPFQKDAEPVIRSAAIQAVRLMVDKRVEPALAKLLAESSDGGDILAILSALEQRKHVEKSTVELVMKQANAKSDAPVRRQAAMTLGVWRKEWPEISKTLERLAESDPDARVREAAQLRSML